MAQKGEHTTCPVCATIFYRYPSQIKAGRTTCSRTCAARHFRDKGSMTKCEGCGTEFYRRASLAAKGHARFCSHACELASRDRNAPVACVCLQCGASFQTPHYSVANQNGGRFCARACADTFKRKLRKRGEQEMFTNWQKREWMEPTCKRCGSSEKLEMDHIVPRFAGGKAEQSNAQTLCSLCNRKKFWMDDYPMYRNLLEIRAR